MIPASITPQLLNSLNKRTLLENFGIEFTAVGPDFVEAKMEVTDRTRQPYGILHGGASAALAESLGSVGSYFCIDNEKFISVGLEINANHIRSVSDGFVTGRAVLIHEGRSTHIWDIRIHNEANQLICISRLTVAILPKK